jgi:hypothetical protein
MPSCILEEDGVKFTRAIALVGLVGLCFFMMPIRSVLADIPYIPKGAAVPKATPQPETFVVFDAIFDPRITNFTTSSAISGASGRSFDMRGAAEFTVLEIPLDVEARYQRYDYVPVQNFTGIDSSVSVHLNTQVNPQKIYAGLGFVGFSSNDGLPNIGGLGVGVSKLPLLERAFSLSGGFWYYPKVKGVCSTQICGAPTILAYSALEYDLGATYALRSRLSLNADYTGDHLNGKTSFLENISHSGMRAGLGLHL